MNIFVPGQLKSPNGGHLHWSKHYRIARDWKERTSMHILAALPRAGRQDPKAPKLITLTGHVMNEWDYDNFVMACKPVVDALKAMRIIDDDSPRSGHAFSYRQHIHRGKGSRAKRGVEISVELLT